MESWIFPLTVLPGIGLLIMSTTHWAIALTGEINHLLEHHHCDHRILKRKVQQLGLINRALVFLYICSGLLAAAGFCGATLNWAGATNASWMYFIAGVGILFLLTATYMLIIYGFRAYAIKKTQFANKIKHL